eukprot:354601-Chlamydomonas_euryale.AAC.4
MQSRSTQVLPRPRSKCTSSSCRRRAGSWLRPGRPLPHAERSPSGVGRSVRRLTRGAFSFSGSRRLRPVAGYSATAAAATATMAAALPRARLRLLALRFTRRACAGRRP